MRTGSRLSDMTFGKLLRRAHMYLGLFLAPWMLMYALSTMTMNHRALFRKDAAFEKESEQIYAGAVSAGAILSHLKLEGTHTVTAAPNGARITIMRQDPVTPRRIVFTPADGKLVVEKQAFRMPAFLERMHRRRGYQPGAALQNLWALAVDLVIAAMVFWAASGTWLCWEMKKTRLWGFGLGLAGCAVFGFFLLTI